MKLDQGPLSKKVENFEAAVALNFCYYNFVKTHGAIRMTPAQAAGELFVAGLEIPPVESAVTAVRVQIVKDAKEERRGQQRRGRT